VAAVNSVCIALREQGFFVAILFHLITAREQSGYSVAGAEGFILYTQRMSLQVLQGFASIRSTVPNRANGKCEAIERSIAPFLRQIDP